LLSDYPLRKQLGEAARKRAQSLFDAELVNMRVAEEYCSLLAKKSAFV
jgi:hypothetical protein